MAHQIFFAVLGLALLQIAVAIPFPLESQPKLTLTFNHILNHTITTPQPDNLPTGNATDFCSTGVWITYPNTRYGESGGTVHILRYLENTCGKMTTDRVSSARFAGLSPDNSLPSVTLFSGNHLTGDLFAIKAGLESITFEVKSIVTIKTQVEFFEFEGYQGQSACIEFDSNNPASCHHGVCVDWWWRGYQSLPWKTNPKSVKVGCNETTYVYRLPGTLDSNGVVF